MNKQELLEKLKGKFSFIGPERISGNGAVKIIDSFSEINKYLIAEDKWISVETQPLVDEKGYCTENGIKEFIAAVPFESKGVDKWWIRHCVIEDVLGLSVVGDCDNELAGWQVEDVTHYQILPSPPKQ